MRNKPFVSIIIPCYNEVKFIKQCLDSIIANDYEKNMLEIIIVDGMSTDGTRKIICDYKKKHSIIKILDNPVRHKPQALNMGIKVSKGSIIIRMDAHAIYKADYISQCVHYLNEYKADNVGGIRISLPRTNSLVARAIANAVSHPFAAGNAIYRTGAKEIKWVDTVFGGCYRRNVFDKVGLFHEELVRGQDREFNIRLRRSGGRILFVPHIICRYFARGDIISYISWVYVGGLTPFYISRIVKKPIFSWRNLVPIGFVMALFGSLLFSLIHFFFMCFFIIVISIYFISTIVASITVALKEKEMRFLAVMPLMFFLTHLSYGLGSFMGLFKPVRGFPYRHREQ